MPHLNSHRPSVARARTHPVCPSKTTYTCKLCCTGVVLRHLDIACIQEHMLACSPRFCSTALDKHMQQQRLLWQKTYQSTAAECTALPVRHTAQLMHAISAHLFLNDTVRRLPCHDAFIRIATEDLTAAMRLAWGCTISSKRKYWCSSRLQPHKLLGFGICTADVCILAGSLQPAGFVLRGCVGA